MDYCPMYQPAPHQRQYERRLIMAYGFVYVLNHDYMPNVYKVGFTDRAPLQRVKELSASTSVPSDFNIVFYGEFENAQGVEQGIHRNLEEFRINPNREFFEFELKWVVNTLSIWFKKESINYTECNEFNNLYYKLQEEQEDEEKLIDSQISHEELIPNEIVEKANEIIQIASDGGEDA